MSMDVSSPVGMAAEQAHAIAHPAHMVEHVLHGAAVLAGELAPVHMLPTIVSAVVHRLGGSIPGGAAAASNVGLALESVVAGISGSHVAHLAGAAHHATGFAAAAHALGRLTPGLVAASGALTALDTVQQTGTVRSLIDDHRGRAGILHAIGGALMLARHPAAAAVAASVFIAGAVNDLIGADGNEAHGVTRRVPGH